jgi:hypothetical protein
MTGSDVNDGAELFREKQLLANVRTRHTGEVASTANDFAAASLHKSLHWLGDHTCEKPRVYSPKFRLRLIMPRYATPLGMSRRRAKSCPPGAVSTGNTKYSPGAIAIKRVRFNELEVAPLAPITWSRTKMTSSGFGDIVRQIAGAYCASCASGASRTPADSLAIFNHFVS